MDGSFIEQIPDKEGCDQAQTNLRKEDYANEQESKDNNE